MIFQPINQRNEYQPNVNKTTNVRYGSGPRVRFKFDDIIHRPHCGTDCLLLSAQIPRTYHIIMVLGYYFAGNPRAIVAGKISEPHFGKLRAIEPRALELINLLNRIGSYLCVCVFYMVFLKTMKYIFDINSIFFG